MLSPSREWLAGAARATHEAHWRELVEADPRAPIALHPVMATLGQVSYFYTARDAKPEGDFALLTPWSHPVVLAPRPLPGLVLKGHALLGGHICSSGVVAHSTFATAVRELVSSGEAAFVLCEEVDVESELWAALHEPFPGLSQRVMTPPEPHWGVRLPERAEEYFQKQFSTKSRGNRRREARKLDGKLVCYRAAADVPSFLEKARRVSANSWQMQRLGRGVRGEAREEVRLTALAKLGALRCYVLERAEEPIAFVLGYQWRRRFIYENPGFDQRFADLSPGTVLLYSIIGDLIDGDDRPDYIDFGAGFHAYKEQFGNVKRTVQSVFIVREGSLAARALSFESFRDRATARVRTRGKALLERAGLWKALRDRYRRGSRRSPPGAVPQD